MIVGRAGIVDEVKLSLSDEEQTKLAASAKLIHDRYEAVIAELDNE
jgi:L-lactate dehydrogenase